MKWILLIIRDSAKHLKSKILAVALQNYTKASFKKPFKNLSYLFLRNLPATFFKQILSKR